mmetsp:Transcript_11349/g.15860  ORF Transcript_11349/g.15860 Transcript_11349/m.15860 type:complete len:323 (+) Transcript_11349:296-1264(+)|eukprot:CAMPEP_0184479508 /NCGR_PEP_ID=MMETSP0113_2-20130426/1207_1 /TAXON_ID=91329 /ORGANISM="Norrisiella sphaerica, Strain BC52" /LENGTH=322 /DNA_ID=CAMNT_0026857609 /DNA_START=300 /DNA_END=1268 /DNA_ORIENTATION=+
MSTSSTICVAHKLSTKFDYAPTKEGILISGVYNGTSSKDGLEKDDVITSVNGKRLAGLGPDEMIDALDSAIKAAEKNGEKNLSLDVRKGDSTAKFSGGKMTEKKLTKLPLPPESIKMVLWDMDNTLLATHTRGVWFEEIDDEIFDLVTDTFVTLVPLLIEAGYQVGVVTFSDAEVAKVYSEMEHKKGKGGPDLVVPVVRGALINSFKREGIDAKQAQKKANDLVDQIYVVGALPDFRNQNIPAFVKKKMPSSKEWHIEQVKDMHQNKTGNSRIKNAEILFFDDSFANVKAAKKAGVRAYWVNPKDAFTEADWREAVAQIEST